MKSVYDFIVKPVGERYANTKKIGDTDLIVNTKIENWKFVNRFAEVVSTPLALATPVRVGDIVVLHQNVFRRFYDMRGKQTNSRSFFKDDLYFASVDQLYLHKRENTWSSLNNRCFIMPIENNDALLQEKEQKNIGILKIGNSSLEALEITPGHLVTFKAGSEWEFNIDNERLYCMKSNDILLNHGHKENKAEYNPRWAKSS